MAIVNGEYGPYDDGTTTAAAAPTWELSAGGDYRRIARQGLIGGSAVGAPNYYGGAGQAHQYDFQKRNAEGGWDFVNPGEHAEEALYFWNGVNSPQYLDALASPNKTPLQQQRLAMPGAVGQAITRSEASLTGGSNEDDIRQELAFYSQSPSARSALSSMYTPDMQSAISQQLSDSSASVQSARAEADSGGFGDILPLVALVGIGIATGGFGLMGAGAGASGTAGTLATADAMAGIGAGAWATPATSIMTAAGTGAWQGAAMGGLSSAVRGGDPLQGALMGGVLGAAGGAAGGMATEAGASPFVSKLASSGVKALGSSLIGSSPSARPVPTTPTAGAPAVATTTTFNDANMSWGDLVPVFKRAPRADMAWG